MKLGKAKKKIGKLTKKINLAKGVIDSQTSTILKWEDEQNEWYVEREELLKKIEHLNKLIAAERQRAHELVDNISALSAANSDLIMENHKLKTT